MKKDTMLRVGIVVSLCFFSTAFTATLRYVHPDSALSSVQAALDTCGPGDVILVAPGWYHENIVWPNIQGLRLVSAAGPVSTLLDGDSAGSVIVINTGVDTTTVISGFTIRNGKAQHGGAIYCENSSPLVMNNVIKDNKANAGGGGIYLYNSPAVITNNTFFSNDADSAAGGIFCDDNSSGTIKNNTFYGNEAAFGGGIFCQDCSPIISDNIIAKSWADSAGGGIGANVNASPTISDNIIFENRQHYGSDWCGGGGIGTGAGCWPIITNNYIMQNFAGFGGGGIACHDATISLNLISENHSGYGGGLVFAANSSPTLTGNTITNNSVVEIGGGILLDENCSASITGNLVDSNTADYGGGIAISSNGTPTITKNFIRWNSASNSGAGIWIYGSGLSTIDSCVIVSNYGDGVYGGSSTNADIHYCDIIDNTDYGVRKSGSSGSFDAEYNFWGDASGPGGSGPGSGDEVSSNVDYDPWLAVSVRDSVMPASPYVDSRKSGTDVVLTWHPVTTDTLGNPETVSSYIVYRSSSPSFVPGPSNSIGTVLYPDTEYTDIGALTATHSYYYLVKSVDWTFNKSKKSNMGYMFHRAINENPGGTADRNWINLPWQSEYDSVSELTADLSPNAEAFNKVTALEEPTQTYWSYFWHSGLSRWMGTNFAIVPGHFQEITAVKDTTFVLVGSNSPDSSRFLNAGVRNWVCLAYNAAYSTVSDVTDELSPSGSVINKVTWLEDSAQAYYSYFYHTVLNQWMGTNFAIIPGDGYEMNPLKDTTWNPTEWSNEASVVRAADSRRSDIKMYLGQLNDPRREPVWAVEHDYQSINRELKKPIDYSNARVYESVKRSVEKRVDGRDPGISHVVIADLRSDEFENLVFTAYRPDRPYDVLTENMVGSGIAWQGDLQVMWFDVGNFKEPWEDGDEIVVIIEATKQGRGYFTVLNVRLELGNELQSVGEISLMLIPEPKVVKGLVRWHGVENDNVVGYSLYQGDRRLNDKIIAGKEYSSITVAHLKPVIRGGYETVYGSHEGTQSAPDTHMAIAYAFNILPNPFAKSTTIKYALPNTTKIEITVYDVTGRKVKNLVSDTHEPGYYETHWLGDDDKGMRVASGTYFIQMNAQDFESQHKVLFVR